MARLGSMCWLCLLAVARLDAVTQRALPDGYTRRVWQTQDGLPESTVQAFAQTSDHYLWIGTSGGLVRFDGARFVVFDRQNTPQIRENSIFCLPVSHDGSLWVGTDGGGVVRYHDGAFRLYSAAEGLTNGFIRVVYEDREGILWGGTDDGLFRFSKNRFLRVDNAGKIPALAVHDIREDHAGRLKARGSGENQPAGKRNVTESGRGFSDSHDLSEGTLERERIQAQFESKWAGF